MSMARRIKHKVKNQVWVRPEIGYDAWQKLNTYAKENNMDFPSAVDKAADLLNGNEA